MIHSDNSDDPQQAEQELRERERQLDSLMGHLPGLAYRALADEHWTCLFVSKGIEAVTGYTPDDFTSRRVNYIDIILPEDRQATREAILTALRERGTSRTSTAFGTRTVRSAGFGRAGTGCSPRTGHSASWRG